MSLPIEIEQPVKIDKLELLEIPLNLQNFTSVGLIARPRQVNSQAKGQSHSARNPIEAPLRIICDWLIEQGCSVVMDEDTAMQLIDFMPTDKIQVLPLNQMPKRCQFGVVLGGDGSLIAAAREFAPFNVPLVGIHFGRLGFMTDIPLARFQEALSNILAGQFTEDRRHLFQGQVLREGRVIFSASALNDVVINRGTSPGLVEFAVTVDKRPLMVQRADALIVSSATGSTAYSLAVNGPVLHPSLDGIIVNLVAPQGLSSRPIVLPTQSIVEVEVLALNHRFGQALASFDTQVFANLNVGDCIQIAPAPYQARLLHPVGYDYFETLRQKLNWNQVPVTRK